MNRLETEKSPYLQLHKSNPIDWYPWCSEAFQHAQEENKPIFLSIGYSACHWCHVIAHESFTDESIAVILNRSFISIKVDKEERPDVDSVYMQALIALDGSGGWPMTIITTPHGEPFFAATYLPKDTQNGMTGLRQVLNQVSEQWQRSSVAITLAAQKFVRQLGSSELSFGSSEPSLALLKDAYLNFRQNYDNRYGGFSTAPKFPSGQNIMFLLKYYELSGETPALEMALNTLDNILRGGIFDHIGGGFCRYSTDPRWLVPHFEKMLYDNAVMTAACAMAWQKTGKQHYKTAAMRTADYIMTEMTGPDGELYCSQDADSDGIEGAYYTFTADEIRKILGENEGAEFCRSYGISQAGNFEGRSIPNLIDGDISRRENSELSAMRKKVYEYRRRRMKLNRDDKVLTAWGSMMTASFALLADIFREDKYLLAAKRSFDFIKSNLIAPDGAIYRRWQSGEAKYNGVLEDYAYFSLAGTVLAKVSGEKEYLRLAEQTAEAIVSQFSDYRSHGFYLYSEKSEKLITRPKSPFDEAYPSGNAACALAFLNLYELTGEDKWKALYDGQICWLCAAAEQYPTACAGTLYTAAKAMSLKAPANA